MMFSFNNVGLSPGFRGLLKTNERGPGQLLS